MTDTRSDTGPGTATESDATRETVREKYAEAARTAAAGERASCGPSGASACGCSAEPAPDPITSDLYTEEESAGLPEKAIAASLGCGNPAALAELQEGEVVLDLGSGGGVDVILSARRVGPTGKAYGVDMTDDMLELARENAREAGVENVEFLEGEIEDLPLPDDSVDVIISNCVINLSTDKPRAIREAARVLRPGGRFAVSDVVVTGPVPEAVRKSMELWIGCVAGALEEDEYRTLLEEAGFVDVDVEPTRVYRAEDAEGFLREAGLDPEAVADQLDGRIMAAFVRARMPDAES